MEVICWMYCTRFVVVAAAAVGVGVVVVAAAHVVDDADRLL